MSVVFWLLKPKIMLQPRKIYGKLTVEKEFHIRLKNPGETVSLRRRRGEKLSGKGTRFGRNSGKA